jgi:hypothetical protein
VANPQPASSLPAANADAYTLVQQMGNIVRSMKQHYPNLETVFVSSRIYAGYATTALNPEPYAYESGFAVKALVAAQINQMSGGGIDALAGDLNHGAGGVAPWIAWGPYLWADGANPRSDGLRWLPADFGSDGTHPSNQGRQKAAAELMKHMINSPFARDWFLAYDPGDANTDGTVNIADFAALAANFNVAGTTWTRGDFNYSGRTDVADFALLAGNFNRTSAASTMHSAAVPESAAVFMVAMFLCVGRRGRRRPAAEARGDCRGL